jgi:hypothetical protein
MGSFPQASPPTPCTHLYPPPYEMFITYLPIFSDQLVNSYYCFLYEGHLESKERFAIKKYLLIIGKKKNMQVLSQTFTYFST